MINNETLIEDLIFPNAWRIKKAIKAYNETVDKKARIVNVFDINYYFNESQLKDKLGIGPKTIESYKEALNQSGL